MDIYKYLKKDHQKVSQLFKQIIQEEDANKREVLFLEVKKELELHADPEDKTFYKALKKNSKGKKDAEHGEKEHTEIKDALKKLSKISPTETVKWLVQFGELKQIVEHHVEDEEGKMFKDGKKIISAKRAKELAEEMEALKEKMKKIKKFQAEFSSDEKPILATLF
jgi:hemerythrin superfamily protein